MQSLSPGQNELAPGDRQKQVEARRMLHGKQLEVRIGAWHGTRVETFGNGESNRANAADLPCTFPDFIANHLKQHPTERAHLWLVNPNDVELVDLESHEFKEALAATGTPAQKWAVKRLVEHCPFQVVRRFVSAELLANYLPDLVLSPRRRQALKRALEFWLKEVG